LLSAIVDTVKYMMDYKLYTLVDITHTGQHRNAPGKEQDRWREQNFNTVLQTLGIRTNIAYRNKPTVVEVNGRLVGFDTDEIIRVWRFDFVTDRDDILYEVDGDPVGYLKQDFHLVPYISGLDELMEQNYAVFNTINPGANIVFHKK
jgi:hypothetical protein